MGLFFNGGERLNAGSASSIDNIFAGNGSISVWFRIVSFGGSIQGVVCNKAQGSGTGPVLNVQNTAGPVNTLVFSHGFSTTGGIWSMPSNAISLSTWYHAGIEYDNSSDTNDPVMYLDGVSQTVTEHTAPSGTASSDASNALTVGARGVGTRGFDGDIADFRLYNVGKTANEFKRMFTNKGRSPDLVGLVLRYKLLGPDAAVPTTIFDVSGQGNDGTVTSTPFFTSDELEFGEAG